MGHELPFELDTIDAIAEAKGCKEYFMAILSRIAPFIIHIVCAVLEYMAYTIVHNKLKIVCIAFFEISDPVDLFMTLDYITVMPDMLFAVLGPVSVFMIYNNPYAVFYNFIVGVLNIVNGALFHARYTDCGNPDQGLIPMVPIFSYVSGVLHLINSIIAHLSFTIWDKEGEIYCGRFVDLVKKN